MRHLYLIARREYLSYVATPGFWATLAFVPLFMVLGMALPLLMEGTTPTRYFTVIDASGEYKDAIAKRLESQMQEQIKTTLNALESMPGQEEKVARAKAAFAAGADSETIKKELGPQASMAFSAAKRPAYILVPPPAPNAQGLRPYLLEEKLIETPDGPKTLYAAALFDTTGDVVDIDYWSRNITEGSLKGLIRRAVRDKMRSDAFSRAGIETEIVNEINELTPEISSLSPEKEAGNAKVTTRDTIPYFAAVVFAFILWSVVFSVAGMLLSSIIEERSGKILDSLLVAAPIRSILMGKLVGVAAVSFTLLAAWGITGGIMATLAGQLLPAGDGSIKGMALLSAALDPGLLVAFAGYFIFGYLMYGSIFLALGSLCESTQEAQTLMGPLIFVLMIPMLALSFAIKDPTSPILGILSWIPLFTPYIMLARLPTDPPLVDIIGTTLVMIVTTIFVMWAAARVFRAGTMNHAGVDYFKTLFRRKNRKMART